MRARISQPFPIDRLLSDAADYGASFSRFRAADLVARLGDILGHIAGLVARLDYL